MSELLVRSVRPTDAADLAAIYSFEAVIANSGQIPFRDQQFWCSFWKAKDPNGVELVCDVDGRAVGHLGIVTNASARRKHVATFGIAVHPDFQGRGVGNALIAEMVKVSDNWLNILRMELTVASDNKRAMGLYLKHGFVVEGEAKFDNFRAGKFTHSTVMARINPAYSAQ